jgi:flagellar motor switch protein FliN
MTADEIESLLRSARESSVRADVVSQEPLGPGDVQHLQNSSYSEPALSETSWPDDLASADELLRQAQQHLSEAMSSNNDLPPESTRPPRSYSFRPLAAEPTSTSSPLDGLSAATINDLELEVSLELGRAELTIEELIALREGAVVPLDKQAGEPIDILANGKLVARGEVLVIDEKFCVRICEVLAPR